MIIIESSINMAWEETLLSKERTGVDYLVGGFNPLEKYFIFPKFRGEKEYLSCHHLDDVCFFRWLLKSKQSLELGPMDINKGALFPCLGHWSLSRVTYLQSTPQLFTTTFNKSHCCHRNSMVKLLGGKYPDVHINFHFWG